MKVTKEKFNEYLVQYARGYIVPRAKKRATLFRLGAVFGLGKLSLGAEQMQGLQDMGVADGEGNIDVDLLKKAVEGGLDLAGELYIAPLGLTLYKADVNVFLSLLETGVLPALQ